MVGGVSILYFDIISRRLNTFRLVILLLIECLYISLDF
jgi:hypothetical protein